MNIFNKPVKVGGIPKNKFDLSHEKKLTLNLGKLVPIMCQEVVPGDSLRVSSEIFIRLAPMIAPIMHRVDVYTHYFYVPNRIVWDGWDDFISKEGPTVPAKVPQAFVSNGGTAGTLFTNGSLADYMGLPTLPNSPLTEGFSFNALPFRAYQLIYNEYYRDQTLSAEVPVSKGDADVNIPVDTIAATDLLQLRMRSWGKDYFTTCLPNPQYGDVQAGVPVTTEYPLNYPAMLYRSDSETTIAAAGALSSTAGQLRDSAANPLRVEQFTDGQVLINELRNANTLQLWLEKQARGGQRLVETIMSHFGVKVPDARVSRPEYLGGGKQHISISEVLSTYDNTANDLPQGNMSGHGISSGKSHGFSHTFPEHGFVIGIMSVLPKAAYQQGFNKKFLRQDKFDYYWPTFAHLGEQAVLEKELYYDGATTTNGTFGYNMRYSEYKFEPDTVHGDFRENMAYWHMGRIFSAKPTLNEAFIRADNSQMDRVFAVQDPTIHKLWCQIYHQVDALRPMPIFGTPRL